MLRRAAVAVFMMSLGCGSTERPTADVTAVSDSTPDDASDDALFDLWRKGLCEEKDVIIRANNSGELKLRISNAKKGVFDDKLDEDEDEDDDDEG